MVSKSQMRFGEIFAPVGVEPTAPAYETGEITVSPRRVVCVILLYYKKS